MVHHEKNDSPLANNHGEIAGDRVFFQPYGSGTVSTGSENVQTGSSDELHTDEKTKYECQNIHDQAYPEQLACRRKWVFHSANTAFIAVHITIKAITGGVN